jgi:hypothetical protein
MIASGLLTKDFGSDVIVKITEGGDADKIFRLHLKRKIAFNNHNEIDVIQAVEIQRFLSN